MSSSASAPSYAVVWTDDELEESLYQREENASLILDYHPVAKQPNRVSLLDAVKKADENNDSSKIITVASVDENKSSNSEEKEDEKKEDVKESSSSSSGDNATPAEPTYLNITIEGDDIHIVEFYAPWCPHCQAFAPTYVEIAKEVQKRSISVNVFFHAVSCTLNENLCLTYELEGYPTVLGYRGMSEYSNTMMRGLDLDLNSVKDVEMIAEEMNFDLAMDKRVYDEPESKYSNSQEQREYELYKIEQGKEAASLKADTLEYISSKNELYHDAGLSLHYILKNGVYKTHGKLENKHSQVSALQEFLYLVDWATPLTWSVKNALVKDLIGNFDNIALQGKDTFVNFIQSHESSNQQSAKRREDDLIWGYVDIYEPSRAALTKLKARRQATSGLGLDAPLRTKYDNDHDSNHQRNQKWTKGCSRGPTSSGFTCGLWELFHIITIGAGQTENQLYGFKRGYMISQHDVVETIRNFVANFFRCDVCKNNFVQMYDNCGHDHCTRLKSGIPLERSSSLSTMNMKEYKMDQPGVAIWLWDVHNAVNVRLMKEKAERDRRNVTKEEMLAAKFPSPKLCPSCWLDVELNDFDSQEVYRFLRNHYWPKVSRKDRLVDQDRWHGTKSNNNDALEGRPISKFGLFCTITPLLFIVILFLKQNIRVSSFDSRKNKSF